MESKKYIHDFIGETLKREEYLRVLELEKFFLEFSLSFDKSIVNNFNYVEKNLYLLIKNNNNFTLSILEDKDEKKDVAIDNIPLLKEFLLKYPKNQDMKLISEQEKSSLHNIILSYFMKDQFLIEFEDENFFMKNASPFCREARKITKEFETNNLEKQRPQIRVWIWEERVKEVFYLKYFCVKSAKLKLDNDLRNFLEKIIYNALTAFNSQYNSLPTKLKQNIIDKFNKSDPNLLAYLTTDTKYVENSKSELTKTLIKKEEEIIELKSELLNKDLIIQNLEEENANAKKIIEIDLKEIKKEFQEQVKNLSDELNDVKNENIILKSRLNNIDGKDTYTSKSSFN